jgi:hypothetical protein
MRYSRLLAWLLLLFVVLGIGAQLLRHALPNGSFKTGTVSRTATSGIGAAASAAGTVASLDGAARRITSTNSTTWKPSKATSDATKRSSSARSRSTAATPATSGRAGGAAPSHFRTLAPGAGLPSDSQCAAWVRSRPLPERKAANRSFNQVTGQHVGSGLFDPGATDPKANSRIAPRIDGAFTGTTQEILRWTACKWGIDENLVYAQAAVESWWRQTTQGDFGSDASACAPGHGLGADGQAGQCPQSFGILQNRYPFERSTWPGIARSTAMNADTAYGIWRACFEGYEHWLNDVERGRQYGAGDALGCMGRWFSGRWHTAPAEQYVAKVKDYLARRIWETPDFQEL